MVILNSEEKVFDNQNIVKLVRINLYFSSNQHVSIVIVPNLFNAYSRYATIGFKCSINL